MTDHAQYMLLSAVVLFAVTLRAQEKAGGTIKGSLVDDSTEHPLEFVNVMLRAKDADTIVAGTVTGLTGTFELSGVAPGEYTLAFSLIGYRTEKTPLFLIGPRQEHLNVGVRRLIESEVSLEEVLVTAEKSLFNAAIDRKVYNVDQDLAGKAGSASELLQNVPSVQVDMDGNVSLRGASNVLIMLNGRTSPLLKKNSAAVLQQMPASSIERIEVITNPSARYRPEGTSGMINIVLKKNSTLGINGSIAANAGNQDRYNGNGSFNVNPGSFNVYGSYGARRDSRNRITTDQRLLSQADSTPAVYSETVNSNARPLSHTVSLGADVRTDDENKFGLAGEYFYNSFTRIESADKVTADVAGPPVNHFGRNRVDDEYEIEYSLTANFEHTFSKEDHTLKLEFSASGAPEQEDNRYTSVFLSPPGPDEYDNTLISIRDNNAQLTLDYANPLSEQSNLEAGYLGEITGSDLDFAAESFDRGRNVFVADGSRTNRFLYDESINALYATYRQGLGPFGFMGGMRAERASVTANLVTLDSIVTTVYFSLYPTLHLTYRLGEPVELQLSYSKRTRRPDGDELNPFPEYRDPRNVSAGNPSLLPEYVHSVELGCQFQKDDITLLPALFYRTTYNRFTSVTRLINDTTLLTTRQNLAHDRSGGVELVVSATLGDLVSVHGSASAFLNQIDATNLGYGDAKSVSTWSSNLTVDFQVSGTSRLQLNSNYNSSRLTPQGEQASSYVLNAGIRQDILDGRASLVLTIADVFKTLRRESVLDAPSLSQAVVNRRDSRVIYLGFTFRFGSQPKKPREDQLRYDDNL